VFKSFTHEDRINVEKNIPNINIFLFIINSLLKLVGDA